MIRVAVAGAAGRMGRELVQAIDAAKDLTLGAAFEHANSPALGQDAGELAAAGNLDVVVGSDPAAVIDSFVCCYRLHHACSNLGFGPGSCAEAGKDHGNTAPPGFP